MKGKCNNMEGRACHGCGWVVGRGVEPCGYRDMGVIIGWFILVKYRPICELSINKGFPLALYSNGSPDKPKKNSTLGEVENMHFLRLKVGFLENRFR